MKTLKENYIGSTNPDNSEISTSSFRATKAQALVMLNLDSLIQSGRQNIKEQDVLNIPEEELVSNELTVSNVEGAYELLKNLKLITVDEEGSMSFSQAGEQALETVKQENPKQDEEGDNEFDTEFDNEFGNEEPTNTPSDMPEDQSIDLQSFDLLRFLRDSSKFRKH